jgi:serine/threonine protein kinase
MTDPDLDQLALDRLGRTLNGKWRLDAALGVGGMATVYAATHRNGHRVAIKMLHPVLCAQSAPRERFLREGYLANKVDHPGAVIVLDDDVDEDGNVFLVMELLDGEPVSARGRAAGGRLPVGQVLWIADRLLRVLEAAHANGIVHRDIKPENLFLTADGNLKVLDFGIARLGVTRSANTVRGVVMGTPGFAAPEQVRGEWDVVDSRADLFAVGATIFALLVGKLVHEQPTPHAHLSRMAFAPAPPVREVDPTIPAPVANLIDRALSFRREDRFQTAAEMRNAVASALCLMSGQLPSQRAPAARMPTAPNASAPNVVAVGIAGVRAAKRSQFSQLSIFGAAGFVMGIFVLSYWSAKVPPGAGPHRDGDSPSIVAPADIVPGVPLAEVSPSSSSSGSTSTRVSGETTSLRVAATTTESPNVATPVSSSAEGIKLPPTATRSVQKQPSPTHPRSLDFVKTRR